jgi:hypothetical protein
LETNAVDKIPWKLARLLLRVFRLTKQLDHDAFVALFDHLRKVLFRTNAGIHNGLVEAYRYTYLKVQVRDTEDNIRLTISSSRSFGAKFLTWANRTTCPPASLQQSQLSIIIKITAVGGLFLGSQTLSLIYMVCIYHSTEAPPIPDGMLIFHRWENVSKPIIDPSLG